MADDGYDPDSAREPHGKLRTGHKWGERILKKAVKLAKNDNGEGHDQTKENDLADFLRGSGQQAHQQEQSLFAKPQPRIDVTGASRWPSAIAAAGQLPLATTQVPQPRSESSRAPTYDPAVRNWKIRKGKGLHVNFATTDPEIIGEGGDESEIPTKNVKGSWFPLKQPVYSGSTDGQTLQPLKYDRGSGGSPDRTSGDYPAQRSPTRTPVGSLAYRRQSMEMEEAAAIQASKFGTEGDPELQSLPGSSDGPINRSQSISGPYAPPNVQSNSFQKTVELAIRANSMSVPQSRPIQERKAQPAALSSGIPAQTSPYQQPPQPVNRQLQPVLPYCQLPENENGHPDHLHMPPLPTQPRRAPEPTISEKKSPNSPPQQTFMRKTPSPQFSSPPATAREPVQSPAGFYTRMQHLRSVFSLNEVNVRIPPSESYSRWLRCATWWFLRGRSVLESNVGTLKAANGNQNDQIPLSILQCYVDLAKCWWIVEEKLPMLDKTDVLFNQQHDSVDGLDTQSMMQAAKVLHASMDALDASMAKNGLLPHDSVLRQGLSTKLWSDNPSLPQHILLSMASLDPRTFARQIGRQPPFYSMLVADTDRYFSFGRLFVSVEIRFAETGRELLKLPAVLSIIRDRTRMEAEITICSQDGQINLHIQSDKSNGLTWNGVKWDRKAFTIQLFLSNAFECIVRFKGSDMTTLLSVLDYDRHLEKEWQRAENEQVVFEETLNLFHYVPSKSVESKTDSMFPTQPIKNCRVRLFIETSLADERVGRFRLHKAYRLLFRTSPATKTPSSLSKTFKTSAPLLYTYLRGEGDAPAVMLTTHENGHSSSVILTFLDKARRAKFMELFDGSWIEPHEVSSKNLPMKSMSIETVGDKDATRDAKLYLPSSIQWQAARMINMEDSEALDTLIAQDST
jgi:hypothetical protein